MAKQKLFLSNVFLLLIGISLLNACGFKLRGAYKLPAAMQTTYVDAASSEMVSALKRSLKASDINVVKQTTDTSATLKLFAAEKSKRVVSVDEKGRAREYTLKYAISFSVHAKDFSMEAQTVSIERDFLFDTEDVLGKSRGEAQLYQEMGNDLVRLILLKLQSRA